MKQKSLDKTLLNTYNNYRDFKEEPMSDSRGIEAIRKVCHELGKMDRRLTPRDTIFPTLTRLESLCLSASDHEDKPDDCEEIATLIVRSVYPLAPFFLPATCMYLDKLVKKEGVLSILGKQKDRLGIVSCDCGRDFCPGYTIGFEEVLAKFPSMRKILDSDDPGAAMVKAVTSKPSGTSPLH